MLHLFVVLNTCIIGAMHTGQCPVQPYIPIYLIVLGVASLLSLCLTYTSTMCENQYVSILSSCCMTFLHLFTFGWLITGETEKSYFYTKINLPCMELRLRCKVLQYLYPTILLYMSTSCHFMLLLQYNPKQAQGFVSLGYTHFKPAKTV